MNPQRQHWSATLLLGLALLLPLTAFAVFAWRDLDTTVRAHEELAERTSTALTEHADKVFELADLLARHIDEITQGMSWPEIASDPRLGRELEDIVAQYQGVASVAIVDGSGKIRRSSGSIGVASAAVPESDFFNALRQGHSGPFVGAPIGGMGKPEPQVVLAVPRSSVEGFDGVVAVSVPVAYFTQFWRGFTPTIAHVVPMIRADGVVLARYPVQDALTRFAPDDPFLRRTRAEPHGLYTAKSSVDGIVRINAYQKVGRYPVYISFNIERSAVIDEWKQRMVGLGLFALIATVAIAVVEWAVIRAERARRQLSQEHAALSHHLLAAREDERAVLAREIHDELGSELTALRIDLDGIESRVKSDRHVPDQIWSRTKATMAAMTMVHRRIINSLHPSALDDLGIESAARMLVAELRERHGIEARVIAEGETRGLPQDVAIAAYRVIQESVSNAVKHARPKNLTVEILRHDDEVRVSVVDDGVGVPQGFERRGRLGLVGMRERAMRLGGSFQFGPGPAEIGARVYAVFPLSAQ